MNDWKHVADEEAEEWLKSLAVQKTQDEFGNDVYNIIDHHGDWIGEQFSTPEAAFDGIDKLREGG